MQYVYGEALLLDACDVVVMLALVSVVWEVMLTNRKYLYIHVV